MIYPINTKKKIKESCYLKENVRSVASVAAWLKDSIAAMTANQELTISRRILDSNFGFYVYWTQGFDINDDSVIHADADKSYGLVAALKCRNDAEWDGEYMDSPYDPKTGDLYCEDYELSPRDNTEMVAEWLLEDYNSMIDLINNNPEIIIGGLKESFEDDDFNESLNDLRYYKMVEYTYDGDDVSDYLGHVRVRTNSDKIALHAAEKYAISKQSEYNPRNFKICDDNYTNVDVIDSDGDYYNGWGVTDHYSLTIGLSYDEHFVEEKN